MLAEAVTPWSGVDVGQHLFLFSPMIALLATMLAIVTCPLVAGRGARTIAGLSAIGVIVAFVLAWRVLGAVAGGGVSGLAPDASAGVLIADTLSVGFQIILLIFLGGVMYLWWMGSAETELNAPEFFILLIGSALGMGLMVSTTNLLMIVVAIETASLPSYAIVGFDKRDRKGAEASLKYMVFGAVSAAIMLYGVSLLYGLTGSLSVADLARFTVEQLSLGQNGLILGLGLFCLLGGIAFKIAAVPFHFWCPDAFEGAKIEVTTWLSVSSKAAGLVLLSRLVAAFCGAVDGPAAMSVLSPLAWTIGIMAAVTCTVGNFAAYKQRSVKRLLAYSSIAHAGYMMMAAAVFLHPSTSGATAGITAIVLYVVIYVVMNLGAFGVASMVTWSTGSDDIESFSGLMRRGPWLAIPMVVCLMSLVGLPPLAGFLGKWWILLALGKLNSPLGWILVVVAVVNTLISLYFYLRIVVQMTLRESTDREIDAPIGGLALVNICAALLLALTVFATPLKDAAGRVSAELYRPVASAGMPKEPARFASSASD